MDIPQVSYDGAEVFQLRRLFILKKTDKIEHIDNHGPYRYGYLLIVHDTRMTIEKIKNMLSSVSTT